MNLIIKNAKGEELTTHDGKSYCIVSAMQLQVLLTVSYFPAVHAAAV